LRASLNSSRIEQTTLQHEFELLEAYLELLAIRMGKRLQYQTDLPETLKRQTIAPMLLQPLVENAIKHGVEPKMEGGRIDVIAYTDADLLHIKVIDTGMGLALDYAENQSAQTKLNPSHGHVGNANVRERLQALYGTRASLTLSANHPQGVVAHLCIPLSNE